MRACQVSGCSNPQQQEVMVKRDNRWSKVTVCERHAEVLIGQGGLLIEDYKNVVGQ